MADLGATGPEHISEAVQYTNIGVWIESCFEKIKKIRCIYTLKAYQDIPLTQREFPACKGRGIYFALSNFTPELYKVHRHISLAGGLA